MLHCAGFEGHVGKQKHAQAQPTDDDVGPSSSLQMAHRLDPLMGLLFDHMHVRAREDPARLWRDCMHAFDNVMLGSQRIKFTPHVILFAAHITGTGNAKKFASDLVGRICDPVCFLPVLIALSCISSGCSHSHHK